MHFAYYTPTSEVYLELLYVKLNQLDRPLHHRLAMAC
jgi:hypothetical protein